MENWNFHGWVALPLEHYARGAKLMPDGHHVGDWYTNADVIEHGSFVEVMIALLRSKLGPEADLIDFEKKCAPYLGVNGNSIPKDEAQNLFDEFEKMYKE